MNINLLAFDSIKGETLRTNGMCVFDETIGHDGRMTTYSALGGMELVVRRAVLKDNPFDKSQPCLAFELTDKAKPRAFKLARFTASEIITLLHSDDPDFTDKFNECCQHAFATEIPSQPKPQTPPAMQDGWGAWA